MSSWSNKSLGNRWLCLLLTISCWLGVSPSRSKHRHIHLIWSLMLLTSIWFACISLLINKSQMKVLAIEKLLYLIEYPSNMIITALFSLRIYRSEDFFKRQFAQQINLMKLLFEDTQKYVEKLGDYIWQLLIMIFSFHGLCAVIDIYWLRFDWLQTYLSNCAHNLVGLMISLSLLQYVLELRIIYLLYSQLNEHFKRIQLQPIWNSFCSLSQSLDKVELKLEQLRLNSITLDEMHLKLLNRFGFVLLVNFVNSLLSFCYELFNVFRIWEQAQWSEWLLFIYRILWLLMHGTRVWSVLIANSRIAEQKCHLFLLLNRLEFDDTRLERAVNRFLLQLQANESNGCPSTVCGIVDLDTLALGGFISALIAIVIFLIQIDLVLRRLLKRSSSWTKHKLLLLVSVSYRILQIVGNRFTDITAQAGAETSVLAIRLMVDRRLHLSERLLWLSVLLSSIFAVFMLSEVQIARYSTSPTVISVDRDYRGWNGSLPAVTLCYYDHIDSFKANELIQDLWNVSIIDEDYFYIMDFLYAVVNATASNYAELTKFAADERFDQIDLYDIIQSINRPFDQVISTFDSNFHVHVQMVMTERGSCYAINSPMSAVLGKEPVQYEELPPPLTCQYGKQQCYIRMDLYESTGVLDVHSPYEVSATEANIVALHKSDEITASFKVLETVASKNLRELSVEQRKCVFNDEETSNLKIYSKSLCLARCRAIMALEMCNCVPFFYPFVDGLSCNPAGFECLLDFKWPIWALHICKCPSTCTEIEYTMQTVKKSSWGIKNNEEATTTESATSSFRWDLIPPKVRFRRDVVFSFEDLIVSFGGVLALFVGISVMGLVQIAYVIIYNFLRDIFKLFRFIHLYLRERFHSKPLSIPSHSPSHVSRAETAELPLFEYVN